MNVNTPRPADLHAILGLQLATASYAANMRTFGFQAEAPKQESPQWYLHLQCPWRILSAERVVTGSSDWYQTADGSVPDEDWDPATGGSLQDLEIAEMFRDKPAGRNPLHNHTGAMQVLSVDVNPIGDLTIQLSGPFVIEAFPMGSTGEFWRLFKDDDAGPHYVCEGMRR